MTFYEKQTLAKAEEDIGNLPTAEHLYGLALQGGHAEGVSENEVADVRGVRASILVQLCREEEAITEYEQAVAVYEHLVATNTAPYRLDDATSAAMLQVLLSLAYLISDEDHTDAMQHLVERMLVINKLIKKRYEIKVSLLLSIVELLWRLDRHNEAYSYFEQASRFFSQRVHFSYTAQSIGERLHRIGKEVHSYL